MARKWIVILLVAAMLFSFAGVISAKWDEHPGKGQGRPFDMPPGHQKQLTRTVTETVYDEDGYAVGEVVYRNVRHGPPEHVWERWRSRGVGPNLDKMEAKFMEIDSKKVVVKGKPLKSDVSPVVTQGRTLVPIRSVAEAFGAMVDWDQGMFLVIIDTDDTTILLKIGDNLYAVNGEVKEMDTTALLFKDRTMVPLRFVAEALGYNVHYDEDTGEITIN